MDDAVEIAGLSPLLDEGPDTPVLDLTLRCNGATYRASILPVETEWAVRVRDEWDRSCTEDVDIYATQTDALLIALLIVLDHSRAVISG